MDAKYLMKNETLVVNHRVRIAILLLIIVAPVSAMPEKTVTFIFDVGEGLCTVTIIPEPGEHSLTSTFDERYFVFVYDTGMGDYCRDQIRSHISTAMSEVDLMIVSHAEEGHYGGAVALMEDYRVLEIWHNSDEDRGSAWIEYKQAIAKEIASGARLRLLSQSPIAHGKPTRLTNDVYLSEVFGKTGWKGPVPIRSNKRKSKAASIVVRLTVGDHHLLFTGDTQGRDRKEGKNSCFASENMMVSRAEMAPIRADVLMAPDHGSNNASSFCFLKSVDPDYVIISAGHGHDNPQKSTIERYVEAGVPLENIYRTDKGDDEGPRSGEWQPEGSTGCEDAPGDDTVVVYMYPQSPPRVGYLNDGVDWCVN